MPVGWKRLLVPMVTMVAAACGIFHGLPEAEATASKYFAAVREHRFDDVIVLYSKEFLEKTPPKKWTQMLTRVGQKLGDLKSYKPVR